MILQASAFWHLHYSIFLYSSSQLIKNVSALSLFAVNKRIDIRRMSCSQNERIDLFTESEYLEMLTGIYIH